MNVRQDVALNWTLQIKPGEKHRILCGTSTSGLDGSTPTMKETLFVKSRDEDTPRASPEMPQRFAGRVKLSRQSQFITLLIERVDLSDEGFYMCEVGTLFVTAREKIHLFVIGMCEAFLFTFVT